MKKRSEISTRLGNGHNPEYIKIRRDAILAMGYCSTCLEWNDRFPSRICTECCKVNSLKEGHRKDERNLNRV